MGVCIVVTCKETAVSGHGKAGAQNDAKKKLMLVLAIARLTSSGSTHMKRFNQQYLLRNVGQNKANFAQRFDCSKQHMNSFCKHSPNEFGLLISVIGGGWRRDHPENHCAPLGARRACGMRQGLPVRVCLSACVRVCLSPVPVPSFTVVSPAP